MARNAYQVFSHDDGMAVFNVGDAGGTAAQSRAAHAIRIGQRRVVARFLLTKRLPGAHVIAMRGDEYVEISFRLTGGMRCDGPRARMPALRRIQHADRAPRAHRDEPLSELLTPVPDSRFAPTMPTVGVTP